MKPSPSRRLFLRHALATAATLLVLPRRSLAGLALERPGIPRLHLGLAGYSLRDYMKDSTHGRPGGTDHGKIIDMLGFVDYCADQGCAGAELTSYYFPPNVTQDYLIQVRRRAFLRGIEISGSAVGNNFARPDGPELDAEIAGTKAWIDHCVTLGAPHLRVFAGEPRGLALDDAVKQCVRALRECGDYAGERGIMLGLENHGGMVADVAVVERLIRETNHDWVRVNLDTGNFYSATPYEDMARLAPYAVNVQFKVMVNHVPGGKQPADFARVIGILRHANYQGYVTLEYEEPEDPWTAIPRHLKELRAALEAG